MSGRRDEEESNESSPWARGGFYGVQGPSPLLPGTSTRFLQPGAKASSKTSESGSQNSSESRGAKWQAMWKEPANSTVRYAALKPPSEAAYRAISPVDPERSYGSNDSLRKESDHNNHLQMIGDAGDSGPGRGGGGHGSRHTVQTELQVLDTKRTWLLLCLPAFFAIFVMSFPPSWSIEINTLELPFGPGRGARKLGAAGAQVAHLDIVDGGVDLQVKRSIQAMKYVQLSVQLADTAERTVPLSELKKIRVSIEPTITCAGSEYAAETGLEREISAITLDTSESFYFDYANKSAMVPSQIPLLFTSFTFGTIRASPALSEGGSKSNNRSDIIIPFDASYYTFDARIYFENREASEDLISMSGSRSGERSLRKLDVIHSLLAGSHLLVASQSIFYSLFDIILRSFLCGVTVYLYVTWWKRNWKHAMSVPGGINGSLRQRQGLPSNIDDMPRHSSLTWGAWCDRNIQRLTDFNDSLVLTLSTMLPEQLTSGWLLFFLLLWQSPMDILLSATALTGSGSPALHVHEAVFHMRYAAKFGFFFCLLVYIAGLKFFPGLAFHIYTQAGLFGTPDADDLHFDGVMGDSGGDRGRHDDGNSSSEGSSWWQSHNPFQRADDDAGHGGLWSWVHGNRDGGTGGSSSSSSSSSSMSHSNSNGDSYYGSISPNIRASSTGHSPRPDGRHGVWSDPSTIRRGFRGAFSRRTLVSVIGGNNQRMGEGLLEADTTADDPAYGLPVHHPLSPEYLDFSWNKLLLLLFSWSIQALCWYYMSKARVGIYTASAAGDESAAKRHYIEYVAWQNLLFGSLYGLVVTWVILIYMSARITGSHLKALNYSLSRHRHLSFRLLLTQTYIWFAALVTWGLYRYHQCMAILHKSFNFLQNSTLLFILFSLPPKDGSNLYSLDAWEEKQKQLMTFLNSEYLPPLGFFSYADLVTFSAIAFTIAYCYLPPEEGDWQADFDKANPGQSPLSHASSPRSAGGKHTYVCFERDLPRPNGGQDHKLFCLETACRLLEVSEQSYFRPSLLHLEAIGAYPLTATDKLHLEKEIERVASGTMLRLKEEKLELKRKQEHKQAMNKVVMNPFDEGYDQKVADAVSASSAYEKRDEARAGSDSGVQDSAEDEHFINCASKFKMNLEPCGLQLLSLFHDSTYQNLGFVACALPSPQDVYGTSSTREKDTRKEPARLSMLSNEASQSKLVICFRGTADVTNMMTDLKAFPSSMLEVQESVAFFEGLISEKEDLVGWQDSILRDGGEEDEGAGHNNLPFAGVGSPGSGSGSGSGSDGASAGEDQADIGQADNGNIEVDAPSMHVGFKEAYFNIRKEAIRSVISAMFLLRRARDEQNAGAGDDSRRSNVSKSHAKRPQRPQRPLRLCFCGHSLGGVLATLLAYDISANLEAILQALDEKCKDEGGGGGEMAEEREPKNSFWPFIDISCYTFGSPRVGNEAFCRRLSSKVKTLYRIELDGDVISMMPPHYYSFGDQVLVDPYGAGTLIVKPTQVEAHLLANHHSSVMKHTIDRYRSCLERCFTPEELHMYMSSYSRVDRRSTIDQQLSARGMKHSTKQKEVPSWMF